jgi:hypothetical protein
MTVEQSKVRLGFIPANRGFFSAELAAKMRGQTIDAMTRQGIEVVVPGSEQTKVGCVENRQEAEICAELFRQRRVQGIVIGAVNFGDEQAAAWTVRQARLDVPVLIFGCQEDEALTLTTARRDSFCGLLSIGEALRQIGAKYTVGQRPICFPTDASFAAELDQFVRVCRVVDGIRNARYGQIGARPEAFWTCRFDEKRQTGAFRPPLATGQRRGCDGHPVLDLDPGQLRGVQLHHHEPAGRRGGSLCLRGRHPRRHVDARAAVGQRQSGRLGRLEQSAQQRR